MISYSYYKEHRDEFGQLLKQKRKQKHLSDIEIWLEVGITGSTYRNAEDNLVQLRETTFNKIAKWLEEEH